MIRETARFCSRIHIPCSRKLLHEHEIALLISKLRDGDTILTHVRGELTNFGLSYWSHAGVYYQGKIYEATTSGVVATDPMYFFAKKDAAKIYRPLFSLTLVTLKYFFESNLNAPYDFDFKDSDKEFYCFELAARAYYYASTSLIKFKKRRTLFGEKYLASTLQDPIYFIGIN